MPTRRRANSSPPTASMIRCIPLCPPSPPPRRPRAPPGQVVDDGGTDVVARPLRAAAGVAQSDDEFHACTPWAGRLRDREKRGGAVTPASTPWLGSTLSYSPP